MPSFALEVRSLFGGYGSADVLHGVSVGVEEGGFLGVIGPNGSGKSTLLRFMARLLPYRHGGVYLGEREVVGIPAKEFCRKVAFVPQDTSVAFPFSVWEMVSMGRIPHQTRLQSMSPRDRSLIREAMALTDTLALKDKDVNALSAGERQRVIIARALAQEPSLLLLDEPTSHLDIGHQIKIMDMLRGLNRSRKLTVVMIVHDLNLAAEYCTRVVLLHEGKVYAEGDPVEVLTYQNIEKAYNTVVVVHDNPMNGKPYVVPVPEDDRR